jgi:hypothetical protein
MCSLSPTEKCLGLYVPEMFCSSKCIYIYICKYCDIKSDSRKSGVRVAPLKRPILGNGSVNTLPKHRTHTIDKMLEVVFSIPSYLELCGGHVGPILTESISETVKYGQESRGIRIQEFLCSRGPAAIYQTRSIPTSQFLVARNTHLFNSTISPNPVPTHTWLLVSELKLNSIVELDCVFDFWLLIDLMW